MDAPSIATPASSSSVRTPDGRALHWTAWGDPDGRTVVVQPHVGASGLYEAPMDVEPLQAAGIRLVTICRAGIGPSDRNPGRSPTSDGMDMLAVVDALDLERAALLGECGGAGATLAFATQWPDRVRAIALLSAMAPFEGPGTDAYMTRRLRSMRSVSRAGWLGNYVARRQQRRTTKDPDQAMARGLAASPDPDRRIMDEPARWAAGRAELIEFNASGDGYMDEWRAFTQPWPFELDKVRCPVLIDHGALDVTAPEGMARWLHERLKTSSLEVDPARGHLAEPAHIVDLVNRLLAT